MTEANNNAGQAGTHTRREIFQQPETWPDTVRRVRAAGLEAIAAPVLTGAGTSAYAGEAVAQGWPGSLPVPTTELLLDPAGRLAGRSAVVSFARSGNSPESVGVVEAMRKACPRVRQIAVTANAEGALALRSDVETILLDPRTCDRSLVMTSSFTNLVVGGLALARLEEVEASVEKLSAGGAEALATCEATAERLAAARPERVVMLASPPLGAVAREASLKALEMTGGAVASLVETYLGLRHGPMSFLGEDTLVVCFLSSDPRLLRYELDLVRELKEKKLGRRVALGAADGSEGLFDCVVQTQASSLPDYLRSPVEIVFPQLLGYHLSLAYGLDPDSPSPSGVINRVVSGVRIYGD